MEETSVFEDTQLCFTETKQESKQHLTKQPIFEKYKQVLRIFTYN